MMFWVVRANIVDRINQIPSWVLMFALRWRWMNSARALCRTEPIVTFLFNNSIIPFMKSTYVSWEGRTKYEITNTENCINLSSCSLLAIIEKTDVTERGRRRARQFTSSGDVTDNTARVLLLLFYLVSSSSSRGTSRNYPENDDIVIMVRVNARDFSFGEIEAGDMEEWITCVAWVFFLVSTLKIINNCVVSVRNFK